QPASWTTPPGGSIRLPLALAAVIEEAGGTVMTSKSVQRILVEGGRAVGVETADGSHFEAKKAVVSTIHIKHLPGVVGERHLPDSFVERAGGLKRSSARLVPQYHVAQ